MNEKEFKSVMANIVRENTKRLETLESVNKDLRVCVYCYGTTFAYVCPECNEYDGLMPINLETDKYFKQMGDNLLEIIQDECARCGQMVIPSEHPSIGCDL
jgi:ribosomal protein S27AE